MLDSLADRPRIQRCDGGAETQVPSDPLALFRQWLRPAQDSGAGAVAVHAPTLATGQGGGHPRCRMLVLKGLDDDGFTLFSHSQGAQRQDLQCNPSAAMTFCWPGLARQVCIEGVVIRSSREVARRGVHSRPGVSHPSAHASAQRRQQFERTELDTLLADLERQFVDPQPPRPELHSGYHLRPERIEFCQEHAGRLHERLEYRWQHGQWHSARLAP